MDLRLLGPVSAWRDGVELNVGSARRTAVLSVLALHANHAVSREQLVAAVWGDNAPASATGNVYTYVSSLRQVMEPSRDRWSAGQLLTSGGGSYCLHVPESAVDVYRFEALREEGRRHRADGDRPAELATLTEAIELWQGEALAGVPGPYAEAQRLRLTELRLATVERHAGLLVELERYDEAITELRALVRAYPLQENLHGMLMTALHGSGRRAEALDVHDKLRDQLLEETGTEPSAALRAIHARILSGVAERPAVATAGPGVFVGRAAELSVLRAAVADVAAGRGGGIWLTGTPGMGKTALLSAALRDAIPSSCRIGWGVGDEITRRLPFGVLLECLEAATGDGALVKHLSGLAESDRGDAVEQAVAAIRHAAWSTPLILVIDDLESADDQTLRVWTALQPLTAELPLLLVGAGAPALADHRLDGLRAMGVRRMDLTGLTPVDASVLVRMVAAESPEPREMRRLLADAGGSPYYLRHLAASVRSQAEAGPAGPPPEVVAAVGAHLDPLAEEARQLLRAAAFLSAEHLGQEGNESTIREVAAVTGRSEGDLRRMLLPAVAAGVLADASTQVVFRHRIVARVLREGTPTALRVMLHRSFAEKIAAAGGPPERVVAQLLAGPVPLDAWSSRWLTARVEHLGTRAPELAIAMLQRARAQNNLDHEVQLVLTAWLARLLFRAGRNPVAEAGWVAARALDAALEAEMRWLVAATHERGGDYTAAAEVVRTMLSSRRAPEPWLAEFRVLLSRLRPKLPGDPTETYQRRPVKMGDPISVIR